MLHFTRSAWFVMTSGFSPLLFLIASFFRRAPLLAAASLLFPSIAVSEASAVQLFKAESSITGLVRDSGGFPLAGALVAVQSAREAVRERLVVTDRSGMFLVDELEAGAYVVRVTKASFLPTVARSVELATGARLVMSLNLQTALDVIGQGVRRSSLEDMKWVLRSSPSARPVLHLTPGAAEDGAKSVVSDASGFLQVSSTATEASVSAADSVGSEFAFSLPLTAGSQVTLAGQYAEAQDRPTGFTAAFEFSPNQRQRTTVAVNMRQGALLDGVYGRTAREVQIDYDEHTQWSDHVVFEYGAAIGRSDGVDSRIYLRPSAGVTWVPGPGNTISASFSQRAPVDASDPIRGREYFDRAVYIPADLERYSHFELAATQLLPYDIRVSAAGFRDVLGTQAFIVDEQTGQRGIVFFDGTAAPTAGVRVYFDRSMRNLEAGVGYTYASAVGFDPGVVSPEDLYREASRRDFHTVTARLSADIEWTQTSVTAVYRWVSGFPLAPIDPYQRFAEYNDPTLSITVAQDLPSLKMLPGKLQAIVDARNLMEPSFGSRRTVYAGHPRLLKGGIHLQF